MKSRIIWLSIITVFVAGGLSLIYMYSPNNGAIEQDVEQLKAASLPLDARLLDAPASERDSESFQVSWTFETRETWTSYQKWLADHPPLGFRPIATTQPAFSRTLPGDFQTLILEKIADGPPLQVKMSFRSIPD